MRCRFQALERESNRHVKGDEVRDRVARDDKSNLPPARREDQRFPRPQVDLPEVDSEPELLEGACAEVVIADARATTDQQKIPRRIRHRAHAAEQGGEVIAAVTLMRQTRAGFHQQARDQCGV